MGKIEVQEKKSTSWEGLWWKADYQNFVSQPFPISDLKDLSGEVRLVVRKNKYYQQGKDYPNYNFSFRSVGKAENTAPEHDLSWYQNRVKELETELSAAKEEIQILKESKE